MDLLSSSHVFACVHFVLLFVVDLPYDNRGYGIGLMNEILCHLLEDTNFKPLGYVPFLNQMVF